MRWIVRVAGALLAWSVVGPGDVAGAQIAPHRAFYELTLAARAGPFVDAAGAFAVEWRARCEGTIGRQRLRFAGDLHGGGAFDYDIRLSTFESADHRRFRFSMRSHRGDELVRELRGEAELAGDGTPGRAVYAVPAGEEIPLPADTLFPTAHLERLIDTAAAGAKVASATVFDGADVGSEALNLITAAIGEPIDAPEGGARAWPMALAYHPATPGEGGAPLFELSFALSEVGVMRDVVLDYGAFALEGTLTRLERLNLPRCE